MAYISRRKFVGNLLVLGAAMPIAFACNRRIASSTKVFHVGYLGGAGYPEMENTFQSELEKLGYVDGKNIKLEMRLARPNTGDGMDMVKELASMNLDLLVVAALPFALEVRKLNPNLPMVLTTCPGMVSNGFAATMERPGGIYTGIDELPPGVTSKRLALLKLAAPGVNKVALLSTTPGKGGHEIQLMDAEKTVAELGIIVKPYRAASPGELRQALENIDKDQMNGMLCFQGGLSLANRQLIIDYNAQQSIPAIYQARLFAETGGLMAWAPDLLQQFREAAHLTGKIIKGASPGELPVKHPEKYYLSINQTAAKKINLSLPQEILQHADHVYST